MSKPGDEGLPYKDAEDVCGGPLDNQPEQGLGAEKGVDGKSSLPPVKEK